MAKSTYSSRSTRLIRAVENGRISSQPAERTTQTMRTTGPGEAGKSSQRAVKFPKSSNALRRYVATARDQVEAVPTVRLRTDPPATSTTPRPVRSITLRRPVARPSAPAVRPEDDALTPFRTMGQLGDVVRRARRRQGLTQAELALSAGTGRRFVSDVEAGKPTVEFERLMKLCRSLGIRLFATGPDDDE